MSDTARTRRPSARRRVVLVDYGAGNLRSLSSALVRIGADPVPTVDPAIVLEAPLVLIAGVGHVESAGVGLARHGLDRALRRRVAAGRPVAGICLGLQLLFESSEEGGRGLGLLRGSVVRVRAQRVPHMGWNTLRSTGRPNAILDGLDGEDMYFAHSYAAQPEQGMVIATADHDGPLVAAVEHGVLAGVQFHPERSGDAGARMLENLLRWSRSA